MYLHFTADIIIYVAYVSFFLVYGEASLSLRDGNDYSARRLKLTGTEFEIASPTMGIALPSVTELSGGGFVATWISWDYSTSRILQYGRHYTASGAHHGYSFLIGSDAYTDVYDWIPGGDLAAYFSGVVTAISDHRFLVTQVRSGSTGMYSIYGRRYTSKGLAESAEYELVNGSLAFNGPVVASLNNNEVVVVYVANKTGAPSEYMGLYRETYTSAGDRNGDPTLVNTDYLIGEYYTCTAIISLTGGGYVVVWKSLTSNWFGIVGQMFDSDHSKVSRFEVNGHIGSTANEDKLVLVAMDDGGFVVVWTGLGMDSTTYGVFAQRYAADGTAVGGYFQISALTYTTENSQFAPAVASLRGGGFIVVWTRYLLLSDSCYGRDILGPLFTDDCIALGEEICISESDGVYSPAVVAFGDGFVLAWLGGVYGVSGQRFAADGAKLAMSGEPVVVTNTTTNTAAYAAAKAAVPLYVILPPSLVGALAIAAFVAYFYCQRKKASAAINAELAGTIVYGQEDSVPQYVIIPTEPQGPLV
jgi:hypothetical protein